MRKKAFRCRNIYTAVTDELIDGYVVTDGNKIIFVGSQEDSKEYIDSNTEVFDVSNNFIMPGFNDFHVHLVSAGIPDQKKRPQDICGICIKMQQERVL